MYCRHCGAEMNSDAPVCPSCGVSSVPAVLIAPTAVPNASLVRYSVPTAAASLHRNRHSRPIIRIPHSSPIKTRHIRGRIPAIRRLAKAISRRFIPRSAPR